MKNIAISLSLYVHLTMSFQFETDCTLFISKNKLFVYMLTRQFNINYQSYYLDNLCVIFVQQCLHYNVYTFKTQVVVVHHQHLPS